MADPRSATLRGRTILIVEDEYYLAHDMVREFERDGAAILGPVSNVEDALDLLEAAASLDGAVLDINLQGEMVYPVAEALRARSVPFVFATGYNENHIVPEYRRTTCCQKPIDPGSVARALFC